MSNSYPVSVPSVRPSWSPAARLFGGIIFAIGAIGLAIAHGDNDPTQIPIYAILLAVGALAIGFAWLRAFRDGDGGIGPILGCVAVPIAALAMAPDLASPNGFVGLQLGLFLFALGHAFARRHVFLCVASVAAIAILGSALVLGIVAGAPIMIEVGSASFGLAVALVALLTATAAAPEPSGWVDYAQPQPIAGR